MMDSERVVQWMKDISNLFITFHGIYNLYQSRNSPCLIRTMCPLLNQILQKNVTVTTMKILSRFSHGMVNLLNKESYLLKVNKKVREVLKSAIYEDDIIVEFSLISKKRAKEPENMKCSESSDPIQKFKTLLNNYFTNAKEVELPDLFETDHPLSEIPESNDAIPLISITKNTENIEASTNNNLQYTNVANFISNISHLKNNFQSKIMFSKTWESRLPNYSAIPKDLFHKNIYHILEKMRITQLYSHQILALKALIKQKKNVIITTSTASGKSLCYILSLVNASLFELCPTALLLFPTKALAQDQYKNIRNWIISSHCENDLKITCFDGDTPMRSRQTLRVNSSVFLINPDILHVTILPNHKDWADIFRRCQFIVIDESHMYKGIFGIHVACILRRLRRLIKYYGGNPQFIVCSATMSQPLYHATNLTGLTINEFILVDEDGSPCGEKEIILFNPMNGDGDDDSDDKKEEVDDCITKYHDNNNKDNSNTQNIKISKIDNNEMKKKVSPTDLTTKLNTKKTKKKDMVDLHSTTTINTTFCNPSSSFPSESPFPSSSSLMIPPIIRSQSPYHYAVTMIEQLVIHNIRTLVFVKARHIAELILEMTQAILPSDLVSRVSTYRGGYLSTERREIEVNLKSGQLIVVIATNALEVGIDVGLLDCTLHLGYPGSIASFKQQAGRAGRSGRSSLAVYIALHSPLEQFYMNNPNSFFNQQIDHICINVKNAIIVSEHLQCAAYEHPFMWTPLSTTSSPSYDANTDNKHHKYYDNSLLMKQWSHTLNSPPGSTSSSTITSFTNSELEEENTEFSQEGFTERYGDASNELINSVMDPSQWLGGDTVHQVIEEMLQEGKLHSIPSGPQSNQQRILLPSSHTKSHASEVSIRGVDSHRTVTIVVDTSKDRHCLPSYFQNNNNNNNDKDKNSSHKGNERNIYEKEIETMEYSDALLWLYEGAIYLHRGKTYRVISLNLNALKAVVIPCSVNYYTEHLGHLSVNVLRTDEAVTMQYGDLLSESAAFSMSDSLSSAAASPPPTITTTATTATAATVTSCDSHDDTKLNRNNNQNSIDLLTGKLRVGKVVVTKQVFQFRVRDKKTSQIKEVQEVLQQGFSYVTRAVWSEIPVAILQHCYSLYTNPIYQKILHQLHTTFDEYFENYGLHAIEHLLCSLAPTRIECDVCDLSCQHTRRHMDINKRYLMVFEVQSGGLGLVEVIAKKWQLLLRDAYHLLKKCPCSNGCPACIHNPNCGDYNEHLSKEMALQILSLLVEFPYATSEMPTPPPPSSRRQEMDDVSGGHSTIVDNKSSDTVTQVDTTVVTTTISNIQINNAIEISGHKKKRKRFT